MKFLILDTSTAYCSVGLKIDDKVFSNTKLVPRQHNKYLLQMISDIFDEAGVDKKSIDFVAYGVGPGSFVGVRLAAAACQAFAVGLDIPVIGFSSMFAIAKSTATKDKSAVILDARMGDFYLGLYDLINDETISENVYKLDEYNLAILNGYQTTGDSIVSINLIPDITDFNMNVENLVSFVEKEYIRQKNNNKLTHETYPVYLRGTSLWSKNS